MSYAETKEIEDAEKVLRKAFPIDDMYGSKASLWSEGVKAGLVTKELESKAHKHYGTIWNYAG